MMFLLLPIHRWNYRRGTTGGDMCLALRALLATYWHTSLPTYNLAGRFTGQSSNIQGHTLSF